MVLIGMYIWVASMVLGIFMIKESIISISLKKFWVPMTYLVGIQISTQVIAHESFNPFVMSPFMAACIYMGMLLFLLVVYISSAVTIPTLKKLVEVKYQAALNDQNLQENQRLNVEELRQLLKKYCIMATTSTPQFVLASTPLSSASSVICAISMVVYISQSWHVWASQKRDKSVYMFSTLVIFFGQCLGVVSGIGSIYRCFVVLRFKSFANHSMNLFSVFKVEKYWTQRLCEWKETNDSKIPFLGICIKLQRVFVVLCKIIELIPILVIINFMHCSYYYKSLKGMFLTPLPASSSDETNEDLSNYVLLLEDEVLSAKYSMKIILDSMYMFKKAEQPHNLLELFEKSIAFEGVETFDIDQIQSLLPVEPVNSWSLPIISLTCIAISIPKIDKDVVENLLKSVGEGIYITRRVEESLNMASEYVNIQKATMNLWHEVKYKHKWLDTTLERSAYEGKSLADIIKSFAQTAEDIVTEFNRGRNGEPLEKENLPRKVIVANSMYRIARTIMYTYESNNMEMIEDELFSRLSGMIADILAACTTNISRVIITKCRALKNRENSIFGAIWLLKHTSEIINRFETRELPNLDSEKMGFIDEWRLHFKQP